jgi:SAM-dependent methyltransferase
MKTATSRAFPRSPAVFAFAAADAATGDPFDVMLCPDTGSGFTHPVPDDLDRYYPDDYREFHPVIRKIFRWRYKSFARSVDLQLEGPGRVLEVGCGNGWMLKEFAEMGRAEGPLGTP